MRYQQNPAAEAAPLEQGLMILEPQNRKFCALNRTSTLLWAELREPASAEELAERIVDHFQGVTHSQALHDVETILTQMQSLGIVVPVE